MEGVYRPLLTQMTPSGGPNKVSNFAQIGGRDSGTTPMAELHSSLLSVVLTDPKGLLICPFDACRVSRRLS
jgi:hypothetical protein